MTQSTAAQQIADMSNAITKMLTTMMPMMMLGGAATAPIYMAKRRSKPTSSSYMAIQGERKYYKLTAKGLSRIQDETKRGKLILDIADAVGEAPFLYAELPNAWASGSRIGKNLPPDELYSAFGWFLENGYIERAISREYNTREMLRADVRGEEAAIDQYTNHIKAIEGQRVNVRIVEKLREIRQEEEVHKRELLDIIAGL